MAVSDRDRRYMERLARDLAETDETPSEDALAAAVADADRDRDREVCRR